MNLVLNCFVSLAAGFQTYKVPLSGDPPSSRQLLRAAYVPGKNSLVLFSGQGEYNTYYDDLWYFDLGNLEWKSRKSVSLDVPSPRMNYGMFADWDSGSAHIFGGEAELGFLNDLWTFDAGQLIWTKLVAKGDVPPPVSRFAQVTYRDENSRLKYVICNGLSLYSYVTSIYR